MESKKPNTMAQFAEAIGLSRQTVSHYFNDPQSVRKSTRQMIEQGLERLDFRPNFHASNLTRRKARAIGIIVPSIIDPFYSALVSTIEIYAEERGYLTVLQCSHNDASMESRALTRLLSINVLGIAMAPLGFTTDLKKVEAAQRDTPIVFMDSRLHEDTPYIGTNNRQSIPTMVDYLCHDDIPPALFTMPAMNVNIIERQQAYVDRMEELGHQPVILNPQKKMSEIGDDFEAFGYEQFLTLPQEPLKGVSTILCVNDRLAFGLIAAAHRRGLKIGTKPEDDLRVAGHDDQYFSQFTNPALTTIAQNTEAIGTLVVKALLENEGENEIIRAGQLFDGTMRFRGSA